MRLNYEKCLLEFEKYLAFGRYSADLAEGTAPPTHHLEAPPAVKPTQGYQLCPLLAPTPSRPSPSPKYLSFFPTKGPHWAEACMGVGILSHLPAQVFLHCIMHQHVDDGSAWTHGHLNQMLHLHHQSIMHA